MNIGQIIGDAGHSVSYRDTNGNCREVWAGNGDSSLKVTAHVSEEGEGRAVITLTIRNHGTETVRLGEAAVLDLSARRGGRFALGGGGTAWTMLTSPIGAGVRDLCDLCVEARKLDYYSTDYALIGNRRSGRYVLLGFLRCNRQNTRIHLKLNENGFAFERLQVACDFSDAPLAPGQSVESEPLYVNAADQPKAALQAYVGRLVAEAGAPADFRDIVGWATWDYYQGAVTEKDVIDNLEWLSRRRQALPVRVIQIDHGFERREGDWLDANDKFPHGLSWLSNTIRARGFEPGLWLCPFLVAPESAVFLAHPDWVIRDATGSPLEMGGYAVPKVYGLDCSVPAVLDWLRELARQVTAELGFTYIKLDGANGQILSELGRLRDSGMTLGAAARRGLAAFREGMAAGSFLLNAFRPCFSIGLCDGMRIGDDVGARWDATKIAKHHGERDRFNGCGEILRSVAATANHFYFHKKTWVNDPDYLVVRQEGCNSELSYEEARSWASIVGLSNGLVMLGDGLPLLTPERVELIEKVIPHCRRAAEPVDFFRKNVPSFYALDAGHQTESWKVVCVLNADYPARTRDYELPLTELGLAARKGYWLFDFWNRQSLGIVRDALRVRGLAPHDCRVFRLTEVKDTPQIIGSDIHISMGEVEIDRTETNGADLRIKLSTLGRRGSLYLRGPETWTPAGAEAMAGGVFRLPVVLNGEERSL